MVPSGSPGAAGRLGHVCLLQADIKGTAPVYQGHSSGAPRQALLEQRGPGGAAGGAGRGPAAWGWGEDQRWTLARVTTLIGRLCHVRYTLRGTSHLLHRIGWSPQVPVHRAAERDDAHRLAP